MHDLATIQRMNNAVNAARERRRALALNNPGEHPKDVEKGRRKRDGCSDCGSTSNPRNGKRCTTCS